MHLQITQVTPDLAFTFLASGSLRASRNRGTDSDPDCGWTRADGALRPTRTNPTVGFWTADGNGCLKPQR